MALKPVTVSQLNQYIGRIMTMDPILGSVVVKGEVSYVKYHGNGNIYFSISDSKARLNCTIFSELAEDVDIEEGDSLVVKGSVRIYSGNGTYSLHVREIEKEGMGDLAKEFAKTMKKLKEEGIFAEEHKKPLPFFPARIGVITSETGAAVRDIVKIIRSRNSVTDVTIFPARVQGHSAAQDLIKAVDYCNQQFSDQLDLLIIGRGGGAPEDLVCFNDEELARAIYRCEIPIISAVGHEIDFSISDFAADARAETPTAAAQMAVPDLDDIKMQMARMLESMDKTLNSKKEYGILQCKGQLEAMKNAMRTRLSDCQHLLDQQRTLLQENNPMTILDRGYSHLSSTEGETIWSVQQIDLDHSYRLRLKDGTATCRFTEKESDEV